MIIKVTVQQQLKDKYFRLEAALGYEYTDLQHLQKALTHRSYGPVHNERLEFLGDSILGMIMADKLYHQFPEVPEGDLTRMRSTLVRETTLAEIARSLNLSEYLLMGPGELKSGGFRRDSILADAVEAILGSIYLDCGSNIEVGRKVLLDLFADRLRDIHPGFEQKDPKTQLQEYLQGRHAPLPVYTVMQVTGESHNQQFTVKLEVSFHRDPLIGYGTTRRKAEQNAAIKAIDVLVSTGSLKKN